MLDDIRATDRRRWYALVRQCRIRATTDEVGLTDLKARKHALLEATTAMCQSYGVKDTTEILWLTRARFVAHQIFVEGIAGATLEQNEKKALDNGNVISDTIASESHMEGALRELAKTRARQLRR